MATFTLTNGNDKKNGTASDDKIDGLAGNDTLKGLNGKDTLLGGSGNDLLDGGVGRDSLLGGAGADTLLGGSDHDILKGDADNDRLDGGNGNDTLDGGTGADTLIGGDGNDVYFIDNIRDIVVERTGRVSGKDSVKSSIAYTLPLNVENLELTGLNDINGTGNDAANTLTGNDGNNLLDGKNGNDTLRGGDGDDTLLGGGGVDSLVGGDGSDTYRVSSTEDRIVETTRDGDEDVIESTVSYDLNRAANVEVLTLIGSTALQGTGNEWDNLIEGSEADNSLSGERGDDSLLGNDGNDTLDGGAGNDTLEGGSGQDVAIYQGNEDDYKVTFDADSQLWTVEDVNGEDGDGVDEGTDLIRDVERLRFADGDRILAETTEPSPPENPVTPPALPVLSLAEVNFSQTEGNNGVTDAIITLALSTPAQTAVTVTLTTADITATANQDYTPQNRSVRFEPGETRQQISIPVVGDTLYEGDERFRITLTDPRNASLNAAASQAEVTILDDDALPVVTLGRVEPVREGTDGQTSVELTVSLSAASGLPVSVSWQTADGTALAGQDYVAASDTLNFAPGVTEQTVRVQVNGDIYLENDEEFSVFLSNPLNATADTVNATALTILDDDRPTPNDDRLLLTEGGDDIDMLSGNDRVGGLGGNDTLVGNEGDDSMDGGEGNDQLLGGEGNDSLQVSTGNDTLSGGLGDDRFIVAGNPAGQVLIEDTSGRDTLDASAAASAVSIDLNPGQASTMGGLTITLSSGGKVSDPLDAYFLQDLSGSFDDDIGTVMNIVPQVVGAINRFQPDSLVGLGSFIDKPVSPFGTRNSGDYVFKQHLALTNDQNAFKNALDALVIGDGNDIPEAQLESLMQVALHSDDIGFRGDAVKVVVLMTDAPFHKAGDGSRARISKANNGDGVLDGSPAGTGEDYPAVAQAAAALKQAGILPIFAVTRDAMSDYQTLVNDLGVGSVVELSSNSSNLVSVIQSGIRALTVATVENAVGSAYADTLTGDANPNLLDGRDGNDRLDGSNGNDTLLGGGGNDSLFGSAGNDVLDGGTGTDLLNGGDGDDRWVFRSDDSGVGAGNRDIVSGFNVPSRAEVIDLSGLGTPLSFIGTASFSAAGQVRTVADPANFATIVQINLDGDVSRPEMELEVGLVGASSLTASDFLLG